MDGMHIESVDQLKKRPPDGDHSKVSAAIMELYTGPLSGSKWRSHSKTSVMKLITEKIEEKKISTSDPHYLQLMHQLRPSKTIEACLYALTNFLFGKGL